MAFTYRRHIPAAPLNTYIDCFYAFDGSRRDRRELILPMGWIDLEFNFGGAIQVYDASGRTAIATCAGSWCAGLWSTCATVEWPSQVQLLTVHFKPGGAYPFLNVQLSDLHNRIVPADVIFGACAADMRERLYAAPTMQARFALLERLLRARLGVAPQGQELVSYAVTEIVRQHGMLSIQALCDALGVSQKHLITQFKRMVGVPPKALARLARFKHVLSMIDPARPVDWGQLAQHAGYYDQAHLNKDFKGFLGHSPTDYMHARRHVYARDPERDRLAHVLPIG